MTITIYEYYLFGPKCVVSFFGFYLFIYFFNNGAMKLTRSTQMFSNVLTLRNNGPEGMDPDGVIEVGAFVSLIVNADITSSYLVSLPSCACLHSRPTGTQW